MRIDILANKGYRSLGVARTNTKGNWEFTGIVSLSDPPREDSKETIKIAQSMGVDVKMITGDHIAIAKEICKQVNLGTNVLQASSILDNTKEKSNKIEIERIIETEDEYRIVELLQEKGYIVGMTGDGVNDAPALQI